MEYCKKNGFLFGLTRADVEVSVNVVRFPVRGSLKRIIYRVEERDCGRPL
jgi:hypothetical protein